MRPPHARSIVAALAALAALGWAVRGAASPATFLAAVALAWVAGWIAAAAWSRESRLEWAKRFLLVHATVALLVTLLEIPALLGMVDYRLLFRTPILSPARNPRYLADPDLLFIRRPHDQQRGVVVGGTMSFLYRVVTPTVIRYDLRYDRHGFRNDRDVDSAAIAVIGDSFVEGAEVAAESTTTAVLGRLTGLRAVNLGQVQYGPRQERVVLERFALPLRPAFVVWLFFEGNDLDDLREYDAAIRDLEAFVGARHGFIPRSFTRNALATLVFLAGNPRPSGMSRSGVYAAGERRDTLYFLYEGRALGGLDAAALDSTVAILADADRRAHEGGARLLVAFVPTKYRTYHGLVSAPEGSAAADWVLNDLPARLGERLAAQGIEYLDLTDALRHAARAGTHPYLLDDSHWSAAGHRIAAEAIARRLIPGAGE